jgi:hypothetical protein
VNADQIIAITSVIAGGAVGAGGLIIAGLSGAKDRALATDLARTERRQQRLADAYIDLLKMADKIGHWASKVTPIYDTVPSQEPPPLPEVDEQIAVSAKVNAYGSPEVKELLKAWRQHPPAECRRRARPAPRTR